MPTLPGSVFWEIPEKAAILVPVVDLVWIATAAYNPSLGMIRPKAEKPPILQRTFVGEDPYIKRVVAARQDLRLGAGRRWYRIDSGSYRETGLCWKGRIWSTSVMRFRQGRVARILQAIPQDRM